LRITVLNPLKNRMRRVTVALVTVAAGAGMALAFIAPAQAIAAPGMVTMATSTPATVAAASAAAVPATPTSNLCTNASTVRKIPCWAKTNGQVDSQDCAGATGQVPLFLRGGGVRCIRPNELVEISCAFQGAPTFPGDNWQDHVIEEDAGGQTSVGHIPDNFVDLHGNFPETFGIPGCAS
jgi:hypothetical protein